MSMDEKHTVMETERSENLSVGDQHDTLEHKNRVQQVHADGKLHPLKHRI